MQVITHITSNTHIKQAKMEYLLTLFEFFHFLVLASIQLALFKYILFYVSIRLTLFA